MTVETTHARPMVLGNPEAFLAGRRDRDDLLVERGENRPSLEAQRFGLETEDLLRGAGPAAANRSLQSLLISCARADWGFAMCRTDAAVSLDATYYAVRLSTRPGMLGPPPATARWIRDRLFDGSTARVDLDALYYGGRALALLRTPADGEERTAVANLLRACAAPQGGFGLLPGHPPDIERTYCAVQLAALSRIELNLRPHRRWVRQCVDEQGIHWDPTRTKMTPATLYWGTRAARLLGLEINRRVIAGAVLRHARNDGGFGVGDRSTLWETYCAVSAVIDRGDAR